MSQILHFTTRNRVLAHALSVVGFQLVGGMNVYDDAALKRLGFRSIREAKEAGKPGVLTYAFAESEDLRKAISSFDEAQEQFKTGTIQSKNEQEDDIRVACATLKTAADFREVWKKFPAHFIQRHEGETKRTENADRSVTETSPGFIMAGEGVSEERARGLGL